MTEYSKVNVKLSNTQLNKLKNTVKNKTGSSLRISLKIFNGNNLPHELLLTTRQKTKVRNTFNNNMSTDLKLFKAQISNVIQSGGFLGSLLSKLADPLMKIAVPLAKNVLAPLGITTAASAIDAETQKKKKKKKRWFYKHDFNNFGWKNEWYNQKICQSFEDYNILLKEVTKTINNEIKEQTRGFLNMLLGTLGASLIGNLWTKKGILRASSGIKKKKGIARADTGKEWDF